MASKNQTKRQYRSEYGPSDILKAMHEFRTGGLTFNKVCKKYNIPKPTLKRHLDGSVKRGSTNGAVNGRLPVFSSLVETQLADHLRWLDDHFFGLSITQVRKLAYEIAEKNHIPHPFNVDKQIAGKKWFYNFRARHPELTIRQPEGTSMARTKGFNRDSVNEFFDIYEKLVEEHGFTVVTTYNMDESGFTTVPKKSAKVVSTKGKRRCGAMTSGERGANTTFVCCMNGIGSFVPPMIIYKRGKMHPSLGRNAPVNSIISVSESGYINSELFVQWLQHFIDHVRPTADRKVLLILDGHTSHSLNLKAITLARENYITLLQLPAHTTHRLQPLDVGIFGPLQK